MEKLLTIIQKLKTDVYSAITVFNQDTSRKIESNASGEFLIQKNVSIENFFEQLNKDGVKNITIVVRRKNGSSKTGLNYKDDPKFLPIQMSFEPKQEAQSNHNLPATQQNSMSWLAGGLNQADAIYKMMDHTRLVQECETMKAKNEILEKDNKELREKVLRNEISSGNSQANAELIKTLAPLLMPVVSKLVASPEVPGLGNANISPVKQNFITAVQGMDDDSISFVAQIMAHFGNENYVKELDQLIAKYNGGN